MWFAPPQRGFSADVDCDGDGVTDIDINDDIAVTEVTTDETDDETGVRDINDDVSGRCDSNDDIVAGLGDRNVTGF